MSFQWDKFLDLAKELAGRSPGATSREARLRSSISRAYYAAFHHARSYIEANEGLPASNDQIHSYIIGRFTDTTHKDKRRIRIGDDLGRLRRSRNQADYDNPFPGTVTLTNLIAKAEEAITVAQRIISNIASL